MRWLPALVLVLPLHAQQAQVRGKELMDAALKALGGGKFLQMKDRMETGRLYSFHYEQLSGMAKSKRYVRYLSGEDPLDGAKPAVRERQEMGKKYDYGYLFDENNAYSFTYRGIRPLNQETIDRYRETTRRNIFYIQIGRAHV